MTVKNTHENNSIKELEQEINKLYADRLSSRIKNNLVNNVTYTDPTSFNKSQK